MRIAFMGLHRYSLLTLIVLLVSCTFLCQCTTVSALLGTDGFFNDKPAITSGISDAVTGISFLDDFNPSRPVPLADLPRGAHGGFLLKPGLYEFIAQSYCLHAGKYAPSGGAGYIYSPLKGPRADVIRNMLDKSAKYPEIPQKDIQVLIWAILAKTKISDMPRDMQMTAARLLTPAELLEINGGALSLIPQDVLDKARAKLPPEVQEAMNLESGMRRLLTKGRASYQELERIAVKFGAPPVERGPIVPMGRWSYHPDGYFIRFVPTNYKQTKIQIYAPEQLRIERDSRGRITMIGDNRGNRIETTYDDTVGALAITGDPGVKGFAFSSIRLTRTGPARSGLKQTAEWKNTGWTLVGVPADGGRIGAASTRFPRSPERYRSAGKYKSEIENLFNNIIKSGKPGYGMNDIMDLGHYAIALKDVIANASTKRQDWTSDQVALVSKAWQYAVCKQAGGCAKGNSPLASGGPSHPPLLLAYNGSPVQLADSGGAVSPAEVNLSSAVAMPADPSRQRLAQSARATEGAPECYPGNQEKLVLPAPSVTAHGIRQLKNNQTEISGVVLTENDTTYVITWPDGSSICTSKKTVTRVTLENSKDGPVVVITIKGENTGETAPESSDGRTEVPSSTSISIGPDGTTTETITWPDGTTTVVTKTPDHTSTVKGRNGVVDESTKNPDGTTTTKTTYTDGSTSVTTRSKDGTITRTDSDGQVTTYLPDGTTVTKWPGKDGVTTTSWPDGSSTTTFPDGTTESTSKDGTVIITTPDGTTTTTESDGTMTITYPDGSTVTLANGSSGPKPGAP